MNPKTSWTEQDLLNLEGVPESSRVEFKQSKLLEQSKEKVAEVLSRGVSAFANSEGGVIIIGIKEKSEGKGRVAEGIDEGVDASLVSPEWLQQVVQSNVSPYLPSLRLHRVRLSGPKEGRVAFLIDVPSGSTAYQASDRRYYGRAEYESVALPDHEVRLRMLRGRVPTARLEVGEIERIQYGPEMIFYFGLMLVNSGEVTIKDLLLSLQIESSVKLLTPRGEQLTGSICLKYRLRDGLGPHDAEGYLSDPKIFPEERVRFPLGKRWQVSNVTDESISEATLTLGWTIYLDDCPPARGQLDLAEKLNAQGAILA